MKTLNTDLFRTTAIRSAPVNVDRQSNTLHGIKIINLGDLNPGDARPWFADETTLSQVERFGNQPNKGIKSRFTHPNMSEDGLGKHIGKATTFYQSNGSVYADLKISDAAFSTPFGDLGSHVLTMASEFPEDFGMSIVPVLDHAAMEAEQTEDGRQPMRLLGLKAVDVVDSPAATDSMFDIHSPAGIPAAATWFFDTHFADLEPDAVLQRVVGFMRRYYEGRGDFSAKEFTMSQTATVVPEAPAVEPVDYAKDGKRYVEMFGDIGALWFIEGATVEECFAVKCEQFNTVLAAKDEEIAELKQRLEAALSAGGEEEALSANPVDPPAIETDPAIAERQAELEAAGHESRLASFAARREANLKR